MVWYIWMAYDVSRMILVDDDDDAGIKVADRQCEVNDIIKPNQLD